jgi:hypothetical protein
MADGESHQFIVLRDGNAGTQGEGIDEITKLAKETLSGQAGPDKQCQPHCKGKQNKAAMKKEHKLLLKAGFVRSE